MLKAKKVSAPTGLAVGGIVTSAISMVIGLLVGILLFSQVFSLAKQCEELGPGVHDDARVFGMRGTLTCGTDNTPTDLQ